MVELEIDDYNEILDWFMLAFGKKGKTLTQLSTNARMTFYKLNFLAEDKRLKGLDKISATDSTPQESEDKA